MKKNKICIDFYVTIVLEVGVKMNDSEVDKMINDVLASFKIDDINVSSYFIWSMRQKFRNDKVRKLSKVLVKKEKK